MARVSTYLNFERSTEAAFNFYKSVFGGEFFDNGIMRLGDVPPSENMPPLSEEDKNLVMHVELPILNGKHTLMGTDSPECLGMPVIMGNNVHINLELDTREETRKYFTALSEGGTVNMELQDMFWGDYFGSCVDRFGVQWMFNCGEKSGE
jgi:PhnB protein